MANNIERVDLDAVIRLLNEPDPILTQSAQVRQFEEEFADWLGTRYAVYVNSGSSANLLSMSVLQHTTEPGEVIVPTLGWVSDIASVMHCGFSPVFVDIDPRTLGMDTEQVLAKITSRTRAVFLTHVLGYNALTPKLLGELDRKGVALIEDVCESYGATFEGRRLGTYGLMANFSFYYAHHLSTIEGGMVTTDDPDIYQMVRMLRSHGMVREATSSAIRDHYHERYPDLNPDFIFAYPAYNVRGTEIGAAIGRSQLQRLDANNALRTRNLGLFLDHLDPAKYFTDFERDGSCNYAFTLVLAKPDRRLCQRVMAALQSAGVEFRRGMSGGGNQVRQPYVRQFVSADQILQYPHVDHVHHFGFYIGNYPHLDPQRILDLCSLLNGLD